MNMGMSGHRTGGWVGVSIRRCDSWGELLCVYRIKEPHSTFGGTLDSQTKKVVCWSYLFG